MTTYLLDACALLAYVKKEPESVKVKELFDRALIREIAICISVINLTEAYYGLIRNDGMETAGEIMKSLDELPLSVIDTVSRAVSRDAARFKVSYSMSLADTFLCATAKSLSATIVTKDSEIETTSSVPSAPTRCLTPGKPASGAVSDAPTHRIHQGGQAESRGRCRCSEWRLPRPAFPAT